LALSLCYSEAFILTVVARVDDLVDVDPGVNVFGQLGQEAFDLVRPLIAAAPRERLRLVDLDLWVHGLQDGGGVLAPEKFQTAVTLSG
jgi:hypothetical protein